MSANAGNLSKPRHLTCPTKPTKSHSPINTSTPKRSKKPTCHPAAEIVPEDQIIKHTRRTVTRRTDERAPKYGQLWRSMWRAGLSTFKLSPAGERTRRAGHKWAADELPNCRLSALYRRIGPTLSPGLLYYGGKDSYRFGRGAARH